MKPRHWYHCSSADHGPIWTARKQCPKHPATREPPVPRLCVCETVAACCAARLFDRDKPVYVYRTVKSRRAVKPRGVWDQVITGEHWLVPPVEMTLVRTIAAIDYGKISEAIRLYHVIHKTGSTARLRIAQYARAVEVLGGERHELAYLKRVRAAFGIGDPETYILEEALA